MSNAIIYACSHRRGGNSDRAVELLKEGVQQAGGEADVMHVRNFDIMPCLACGFCDKSPQRQGQERCVLGEKDQAWELFRPMFTAKVVLFASPIYFYHLPSMFKTWIDRGQQFWKARLDKEPWIDNLPKRTAHTVFIAGQPTGTKLFEGSRLTLKYFVKNFNMKLAEPLAFRGVDGPNDLTKQAELEKQVLALGRQAWEEAV
ncbi:MAG: flavodoxin family protein [Pseudodesulfovibrio sp.]